MDATEKRYLELLSRSFPTVAAASAEKAEPADESSESEVDDGAYDKLS